MNILMPQPALLLFFADRSQLPRSDQASGSLIASFPAEERTPCFCMVEAPATNSEDLQEYSFASVDCSDDLGQQEEEIQGLQAICGSDCISCLDQAGPSSKLEALKATLLIHVDLPEGQLQLTVGLARAGCLSISMHAR